MPSRPRVKATDEYENHIFGGPVMKKKAAFCLAGSVDQAETIVASLKRAGFENDDISALYPNRAGNTELAHVKSTKAPEGAAVGATVGGVTGVLIGMGIPEYEAKVVEGKLQKGQVLISVHTDDDADVIRAKRIFRSAEADDIGVTRETEAKAR
jgi:hypothetical protein